MGVLFMFLCGVFAIAAPLSTLGSGAPSPDLIAVSLIMAGFEAFFYLLCLHPRLRLSEEGIESRGVFAVHFAPWRHVETLNAAGGGRLVIGLSNGEVISHFHYGGSLGGELIRYRHHRGAVRRIEEWRSPYAATGDDGSERGIESRVRIPALPALTVLLLTLALPLGGAALHHLSG